MILGKAELQHSAHQSVIRAPLSDIGALEIAIRAPSAMREQLKPVSTPFVPVAILAAGFRKQSLHIDDAVEDIWWLNLKTGFWPIVRELFDLAEIDITRANSKAPEIARSGRSALMFSAGVDSFYSLARMQQIGMKPDCLVNIHAGAHDDDVDCWNNRLSNIAQVAAKLDLPLVAIETNFHRIVPQPHVQSHTIRNLAAAYSLYPAISDFIYSATYEFADTSFVHAKQRGSISYIDHSIASLITPSPISFSIVGCEVERIAKTNSILNDPLAHEHLDVCLSQTYQARLKPGQPRNCGTCVKCLRTMFTLEHFGALDSFKSVFPVASFREQRPYFEDKFIRESEALDRAVLAMIGLPMPGTKPSRPLWKRLLPGR